MSCFSFIICIYKSRNGGTDWALNCVHKGIAERDRKNTTLIVLKTKNP